MHSINSVLFTSVHVLKLGINNGRVVCAEGEATNAEIWKWIHGAFLHNIRTNIAPDGMGLLWTGRKFE